MTNLTNEEKKALIHWTSPSSTKLYRKIKNVAENKYLNATHQLEEESIEDFNYIENIFQDKSDNSKKFKTIYRADVIENQNSECLNKNQLFEKFRINHSVNNIFTMSDIIASFSAVKELSTQSLNANDKNTEIDTPTVMYILEKRISKYLYIAQYSNADEEEIFTLGIKKFKVLDLTKYENNHVEIRIEEVE